MAKFPIIHLPGHLAVIKTRDLGGRVAEVGPGYLTSLCLRASPV